MNKYTFYITTKVEVETDLRIQDAIDEFQSETDYNFDSTENVTVLHTEYLDTNTQYYENN